MSNEKFPNNYIEIFRMEEKILSDSDEGGAEHCHL